GECVRHHVALSPTLQPIVANSSRCLHGRFDIAGLDEPPLFLRMVCPYSGKTVGLQLYPHLELIGLDLVHAALRLMNLGQDSQQILHVVTDLVCDHIGLGELTALASSVAAMKPGLEILKKRGVEIDLLIVGTIERAHSGLGKTA